MLLPSSRWGECPPIPTYSLGRRKRLPGKCSGWSLSTPFLLPHTSVLPLPTLEGKFRFQSETRPNTPAHAAHTRSSPWKMGLSRKGAGQEHR